MYAITSDTNTDATEFSTNPPALNLNPMFHVSNFLPDGFVKFADVGLKPSNNIQWIYTNQHSDMYSDYFSWVYLIALNDFVVKIGESGQPMAILSNKNNQPITGTTCRMGRIANHVEYRENGRHDTDTTIRDFLNPYIATGSTVSIYARQCPVLPHQISAMGKSVKLECTMHKSVELVYLNHCVDTIGEIPILNKGLK